MLKSLHSHFFMAFPKINPKQPFPSLEEEVLAFWEKEKIFEKSLAQDSPAGEFKFFDGPPFATGLPHYGHILQGVIKDLIPRYKTMRGYRVPRIWGWDCHGLPVENLIEKDLGLKSKQEIEEFGIAKFNEKCRESVLKFAGEWQKTVKRMGRWIDMENAYKTMDLEFMNSVWWVFGELWKKGLIYEGLKPMHVCPRCETPLSNFEVGLNYRDVTDLSAMVKFELEDEPGTYLLAWTTTPWTLPGNVALAVNPKVEYVKVKAFGKKADDDFYVILSKERYEEVFEKCEKDPFYFAFNPFMKKIEEGESTRYDETPKVIKGKDLIGKTYKPLFDYYPDLVNGDSKDSHEVIPGMYFITFNTENSAPIFENKKLRDACAEAFREVAEKNNYKIYELAVMPDHVHLVVEIEEGGESLPKTLQQLKGISSYKIKPLIELTYHLGGRLTGDAKSNGRSTSNDKLASKSKNDDEFTVSLLETKFHEKDGRSFSKLWRKGYDKKFIYSKDEYAKISDYIRQNPVKKKLPPQNYAWLKTFDDSNQPVKSPKQKPSTAFRIVAADFVTTDEGTGIVHIAPAFGEDDYELAKKENLPIIQNVSLDGKFTDEVADFAGMEVKPKDDPTKTDRKIVEFLGDKIFASENYRHSYPFCWRCESPLLNYATSSWFVAVEKIKKDLLAGNEKINWVPSHIKNGRFGKWLEGARDWAISRNRFWGAPLPIWRCEKCGKMKCVSSRDELEKLANEPRTKNQEPRTIIDDLHKHFVDKISWKCDCGAKTKRVPEVLDCWFESGSMPFASQYAVSSNQSAEKNKKTSANCQLKTENCTADFIAEAQDQTRGWFYTLHVLATAIQNKPAFSNCVCSGLVLAEDGEKMSKSKQNFPPPQKIFDKYGADAMRLYLMQSQVTHAEDLRFSERGVDETLRSVLLPLWNTFYFFTTYANADGWQP
ncbi:class I tRNA ligase family protein, partial [Patescibacteria group bacterium]|nr:class I tRNA ligase family protein [Patescibacteria group bacterium]